MFEKGGKLKFTSLFAFSYHGVVSVEMHLDRACRLQTSTPQRQAALQPVSRLPLRLFARLFVVPFGPRSFDRFVSLFVRSLFVRLRSFVRFAFRLAGRKPWWSRLSAARLLPPPPFCRAVARFSQERSSRRDRSDHHRLAVLPHGGRHDAHDVQRRLAFGRT